MERRSCSPLIVGAVVALTASAYVLAMTPARSQQPAVSTAPSHRAVLDRYCVTCHNQRAKTGGLTLDNVDVADVGAHPEIWEKVVQKLHGNLMPPAGKPRPDEATYKGLIAYLETSLDKAAEAKPDPGRTEALHRLNRAEYRNAVRDLLALDIDVSSMLPADDVSYGFDNIAGVQRMSPTLMERYLAAAQKISGVAVGASARAATTDTFLVPPELRQDDRLEGLPFGTRGGTALRYTFPRDGDYGVRVQLTQVRRRQLRRNSGLRRAATARAQRRRHAGARLRAASTAACEGRGYGPGPNRRGLDATGRVRFPAKAGPRTVALTFLNRTPALLENLLEPFQKPVPGGPNGYYTTQKGAYLRSVEISGPFDATGPGDTPSRERDLRLPAHCAGRRGGVRQEDSLDARPARVQAAGDRLGSADAALLL